jgi:ubiquinone biosynthesis protein
MFGFKHRARTRQIISILVRHGFGWLVNRLGLGSFVPFHRGLLGHPRRKERYTGPEHLRMAFEELGPTYIKLGQILSTRPDLISPLYTTELSRLQDSVPPLPFEAVQAVLQQELGKPCDAIFHDFDPQPVASASIGQVYRAVLADGKKVVVKIQKPGVAGEIEKDLAILREMVQTIKRRTELGKMYDPEGLLDEFAFTLRNELDYIKEGQNADRFRVLFKDERRLDIPAIYWQWTTRKVLVMQEIQGIKVNELSHKQPAFPVDRHAVAEAAVEITFREVFEHGFFHADPHPGNFVVMPDNRLGLMDFGMVGYIDENCRESFFRFSYAVAGGRIDDMMDALRDLGITGNFSTSAALKRDLSHLYLHLKSKSLDELLASEALQELMRIAFRHRLSFPPELALLFKVLAMCESLGAMLDPGFKLLDFAVPYMKKMARKMYSPEKLAHKIKEDAFDLLLLAHRLPRRLSRLIRQLELGDVQLNLRQADLQHEAQKIHRALNRIMAVILMILLSFLFGAFALLAHFLGFHFLLLSSFLTLFAISAAISLKILWDVWRGR